MSQELRVKVLPNQQGSLWICYYNHRRYKAGDEIVLSDPKHFSHKYHEPIGWTPEGYTPKGKKSTKKMADLPRTALSRNPASQANARPAAVQEAQDADQAAGEGAEAGDKKDDAI